jgi:hypothetical protein
VAELTDHYTREHAVRLVKYRRESTSIKNRNGSLNNPMWNYITPQSIVADKHEQDLDGIHPAMINQELVYATDDGSSCILQVIFNQEGRVL